LILLPVWIYFAVRELLKLWKYLYRYRFHYCFGILALIVIDLLQLIIPRVLKTAIDELTSGTVEIRGLLFYALIIMIIAVGIAVGRFFWRYLIIGSSRRIERSLRTDFYRHLLTLDFTYYDNQKTGDLMAHAVNDINAVRMAMGIGLIILIDVFIIGIAALGMMVSISLKLTLYALIPFPFIALISIKFGRLIHRLFEKVQESFAILTERVRENLSGMRVIKVFVQETGEISKFTKQSEDYIKKNVSLIRVWGMFFPLIIFLASLGQVIILLTGGEYVIYGDISIGSFVAFVAYLQILVWPMIAIGWAINLFQRGAASQARLNRIFSLTPRIKGGRSDIKKIQGTIEFKDVTFAYQGKDIPALKNISLNIQEKDFIGVTGPIGSGKTSFVNLILRLYEAQSGLILIDGKDIKSIDPENLRKNIAYVPQDTFLFSETIRENIIFGNQNVQEEEIEHSAKIAQIYDEIMALPEKFSTRIGERGVTLSGGQKQRIALARALLMKCPILILDDAVSSVDAETELKILSSIKREIKSRTSIIISHRAFVFKDASKIIVFDNGHIAEQGTHKELLAKKGIYYDISKIQQIEMELKGK
jgi:ATP-binding cassette subfamily B multidrug efflux pump